MRRRNLAECILQRLRHRSIRLAPSDDYDNLFDCLEMKKINSLKFVCNEQTAEQARRLRF